MRSKLAALTIGMSLLLAGACEVADSHRCERDIRSELGADVAVTSGAVFETGTHEWRTTVSVDVYGDAGARPELRESIEKIVRRDFRSHVTRVQFD